MDRFLQHCGQNRLFDIMKLFFPLLVFGVFQRFSFDKVCVKQPNQSVFGCRCSTPNSKMYEKKTFYHVWLWAMFCVQYISIRLNWAAQVVKWRKLSSVMKCVQMRINIFIRWRHRTLSAIIKIFFDEMNDIEIMLRNHSLYFICWLDHFRLVSSQQNMRNLFCAIELN